MDRVEITFNTHMTYVECLEKSLEKSLTCRSHMLRSSVIFLTYIITVYNQAYYFPDACSYHEENKCKVDKNGIFPCPSRNEYLKGFQTIAFYDKI